MAVARPRVTKNVCARAVLHSGYESDAVMVHGWWWCVCVMAVHAHVHVHVVVVVAVWVMAGHVVWWCVM
jgi:hypothetical protein